MTDRSIASIPSRPKPGETAGLDINFYLGTPNTPTLVRDFRLDPARLAPAPLLQVSAPAPIVQLSILSRVPPASRPR